jgi:hypothetical protein
MPRLKNEINDKDRKAQCVLTSNTVVYKVPIAEEADKLGHFIECERIDSTFIFRFATKREAGALRIERGDEPFHISFQ